MTDIAIIILVFAIIFIIAFVILPAWRQHHDKRSTLSLRTQSHNEAIVNDALKQLNCTGRWTTEGTDRLVCYDYQSGHFRIRLSRESPYARLSYLFFYDTGLDHLEAVRSLCNQCNLNSENCRIAYTVNQERGVVDLHALCGVLLSEGSAHEVLSRTMSNMFGWQTLFVRKMDELTSGTGDNAGKGDEEKDQAQIVRELHLLREQEIMHQEAGTVGRGSTQRGITLAQVLSTVMGLQDVTAVSLDVTTDAEHTVVPGAEAAGYDLSAALIADGKFAGSRAQLDLTFSSSAWPGHERHVLIHLQAAQGDSQTLYYRITLTLLPLTASAQTPVGGLDNRPVCRSLLVAYDLVDPQARLDEFRYHWKEALQKTRRGQQAELSAEEKLLSECVDPHVGYNVYRGHSLLLQGRCYEALACLLNAYASLKAGFDKMGRTARSKFYEVAYYVGFCYAELQQYDQALYYLQLIVPLHRITYTEEYINCLVNSGDVRAMSVIDGLLGELDGPCADDDDSERDRATESFVRFLYRRKAYVYVERGAYDEAEQLLKRMLDDPESSDFAINELAFLQKQKEKASEKQVNK